MVIKNVFLFLLIVFNIKLVLNSVKYPINENIGTSEQDKVTAINIEKKSEYDKTILENDYVISIFHMDWCIHCRRFLPIFDEVSSYTKVKHWKFLKIACSKNKQLCKSFYISGYPTIKVYRYSEELKLSPPRELEALLEFLLKISNNPLINIKTDKFDFYKDYGTFSPIVEYNPKNYDFIGCINSLANKKYLNTYYFGIIKKENLSKEKIFFDFDGFNVEYIWDNNCENVNNFLNENTYPILSEVDVKLIRKFLNDKRTVFILFGDLHNNKIDNFIHKYYKNIAYKNRKYVFGFIDYYHNQQIANYFKVNITNSSEIVIYIKDFDNEIYHIHKPISINQNTEEEISNKINKIINNISKLKFTSGYKIKDFFIKLGLAKMSLTKKIIIFIVFFFVVLAGCIYLFGLDEEEDDTDNKKSYGKTVKEVKKDENKEENIKDGKMKKD